MKYNIKKAICLFIIVLVYLTCNHSQDNIKNNKTNISKCNYLGYNVSKCQSKECKLENQFYDKKLINDSLYLSFIIDGPCCTTYKDSIETNNNSIIITLTHSGEKCLCISCRKIFEFIFSNAYLKEYKINFNANGILKNKQINIDTTIKTF